MQNFYLCKHCGSIAVLVVDKGVPWVCCGENMTLLAPNTVDASQEKHLPVITSSSNSISVQIGSALHPMEDAHHIAFVYVVTKHGDRSPAGGQRKPLNVDDEPRASFAFVDDQPVAVYAYCNLHGLWKTEV